MKKACDMKIFFFATLWIMGFLKAQDIRGIQLFNPQTNDQTPVISFGEHLVLRFDDFTNRSTIYRYTIRHFDRNWQNDGLFFTEYAQGALSGLVDQFQYSFNTHRKYTNYELIFPNDKMKPKISGNFELVIYKDNPDQPLFTKKFCVVEKGAVLSIELSRITNKKDPSLNQRIEVQAMAQGQNLSRNVNTLALRVMQNNNWNSISSSFKPSSVLGNKVLFQQLDLSFAGNNEFYYFDNKNLNKPFNMVARYQQEAGEHHTYLNPVWAYPMNYQYQPDTNGAFYFRRNDMGIERNANTEADYSWVYFVLDSQEIPENIYVLGVFNNYTPSSESRMYYDPLHKQYVAKMYLKQGFYNYILAVENSDGSLDYGKINGNFWQTQNLYQAFLYYRPFGNNYDGLLGYGEWRPSLE